MNTKHVVPALLTCAGLSILAFSLACGSGPNSSLPPTPAPASNNGHVAMSLSDASTEDWAVIGVKVLSITLTPTGGGTATTIFTAPATPAMVNLVQLDQLSEVLGSAQVPAGSYQSATLTLSANPGDVTLTAAANPSSTFAGVAGATVLPADIQIKNAKGSAGALTTSLSLTLAQPLVVTANATSNLDLEFVLSHPAFIVDHQPAGGGDTIWTVNFAGTVRHNLVKAVDHMILRHLYGTVTGVSTDNTTVTITRDFPAHPVTTPLETPVATLQTLPIVADSVNGTLFYDEDAKTKTKIMDFSSIAATLPSRFIRSAVRFQPDGTLVAVRMWASSTFNSVWLSPEGHVSHVALGSGSSPYQIFVENENGAPVPITINNETQFFYRTPQNALADATPLATGTGFMDAHSLVRGFKVHVNVADPLAATWVAESVDIENANYSGYISGAANTGYTYTHTFADGRDNYVAPLSYIPATTANGNDGLGNLIDGFKWWNLTLPTLATSGSTAVQQFVDTVAGAVDFGGSVGAMKVWGSSAVIPDTTLANTWAARWSVIQPIQLPKGKVVAPFAATATGGGFSMTVKNGDATPVVVNLSSSATAATTVYQIDVAGGIYTLSLIDITTPAGLAAITANLGATSPVQVYGVPKADGSITAYVLYYTTTAAL